MDQSHETHKFTAQIKQCAIREGENIWDDKRVVGWWGGGVVRRRAQEREGLLWLYVHSKGSDWVLGCVSAFGNRCDVFKQVGITGMSGIASLYRTLDVLSPVGKLSLDHMLQSHITPTPWLLATHQHPTQPLPNPLPDHQLCYPIWVSPLPQPPFHILSNALLLFFLEWKCISHALCAGGGGWWKSV